MRGRYEFVLNKKVKDYFESQEEDKLEAYSLYLANLLGLLHSRQNSSQELAQILQQNRDFAFDSLKAMKEAYVQEVRTLSQQ